MFGLNAATGNWMGPANLELDGSDQSTWNRYRSRADPHFVVSNPARYSGEPSGGDLHPSRSAGSIPLEFGSGESRYTRDAGRPWSMAARSNATTATPPQLPLGMYWLTVM